MTADPTHPAIQAPSETSSAVEEKKSGLGYWAERVLEEAEKASHDFAADPVHDLRVAIRRCRSLADGFLSIDPDPAWRQMKKLGKGLFASLGELRDTQVMMAWIEKLSAEDDPLRHVLLGSLQQKEEALKLAAREAVSSFDSERWMSLNRKLSERATRVPLEGVVFQYLALERWHEAHELHRIALRNRSAVAYHQLRIGIKRFRYTVENFLPDRHKRWSRDLRDLQDALGEVHDFDVLWVLVKSHPEVGPQERILWQKIIAAEREKRIALYRRKMMGLQSLWQKWRAELPAGTGLAEAALEKMRTWAAFHDPDDKHTDLVTRLALELFDGLAREGLFPESEPARRILEAAAVLHDVGRGKDSGHRKRGYRMIRGLKPPVGWTDEYLQGVAIVAHYHRGGLPLSNHPIFAGLPAQRRVELMPLAGVLRLANALDDAHDQRITSVAIERREGILVIHAQGLTNAVSPFGEQLARARYLLENCIRMPIVLKPLPLRRRPQS
ncbi:MAG TPA: CHAD domain-containing protein [Candidatus Angelobacter sp.]|jgi:CHAD domain-containing protein|nr:CHAD domain-containing protein [Candidatus Angelobacter sp.]